MNRATVQGLGKPDRADGGGPATGARPRRILTPQTALLLVVAAALLVSIGQAVAISTHIQATLGDVSNTLYLSSLRQLQLTTFLRVAVAAIAFWLIVFRRRAGYVIAIAYGVFTVVLYTISLTTPTDPGPSLAPAALYALGMVAAVVMTLGGALALRR
jgi:peptidoglycan/LPS O-acetylase OafA/YrhL